MTCTSRPVTGSACSSRPEPNSPTAKGGNIGRNGSVLEVLAVGDKGVAARSLKTGREGLIAWDSLTDKAGRVRLAYGDVMTIHTAQGSTCDEHIYALPAGSKAVNGLQAYTAGTRHRRAAWLITSQGAERREIMQRRPLNDRRPIGVDDEWANVARNLGAQPVKEAAVDFLENASRVRRGSVRMFQAGSHAGERRSRRGSPPSGIADRLEARLVERALSPLRHRLDWVMEQARHAVRRLSPRVERARAIRAQDRGARLGA